MNFRASSTYIAIAAIFAVLGTGTVGAATSVSSSEASSNSNDINLCANAVALQCNEEIERQIKFLSTRTMEESNGNLQSYRNGEAVLDDCWKCMARDNLEKFCIALDIAKDAVKEKIFLPTPVPCQPFIVPPPPPSSKTPPINTRPVPVGNRPVYIQSTFKFEDGDSDEKGWCLQAINIRENANLNVRPCQKRTKQKWLLDDDGNIRLSMKPKYCIVNVKGKILKLGHCDDDGTSTDGSIKNLATFSFDDSNGDGRLLALKRSNGEEFYFAFNTYKKFEHIRLYKGRSMNKSIPLWKLEPF